MEKKNRVQLDMTNGALDRLDELKDALGLATRAETIRASLNITWNFVMKGFSGDTLSADAAAEQDKNDVKNLIERVEKIQARVVSKLEDFSSHVMNLYSRVNDIQKEREKEKEERKRVEEVMVKEMEEELRSTGRFSLSVFPFHDLVHSPWGSMILNVPAYFKASERRHSGLTSIVPRRSGDTNPMIAFFDTRKGEDEEAEHERGEVRS